MVFLSSRHQRSTFATAVLCVIGSSIAGCGVGEGSTTGKRITLATELTTGANLTTFTTGFGWDVRLTRAAIATKGFYYFDGPPPTALLEPKPRNAGQRVADWFVGSAWAHPGHYQAGDALGQALFAAPIALDLFSRPPTPLPDGAGVTGSYRSAQFLLPAESPQDTDAVLGGHLAIAEGSAIEPGATAESRIYFRLVADYPDIEMYVNGGAVDGCALDETVVAEDGTISVEIKPAIWLNLVDFAKLEPGTEENPTEARDAGFSQGVTQLSAYHFSYSKSADEKP